ncbi:hypothetical protein HPB49_012455 [Dermacentor silvarum]|uniref:Uncharacterized protein n=1 Tax=Dermacentor silvarum TaxID=543639 RepID=A0ACB8E0D9_DERSI|nr:hypothetical protein HPB49_012455 [Dermacentor silvarum]
MHSSSSQVSKEMAPPDSQQMVRTLGVREWPYTVALEAGLVYTACHVVYYIFSQTGHKSFTHFRLTCRDAFPYSHEGCVANVCEPATFEQRHTWKRLPSDERVWDALGCHPRRALDYTDEVEQHLVGALVHHSMIVQDELGLDYSNRSGDDGEPDQVKPKCFAGSSQWPHVGACLWCFTPGTRQQSKIRILKEMVPADRPVHQHFVTGHSN